MNELSEADRATWQHICTEALRRNQSPEDYLADLQRAFVVVAERHGFNQAQARNALEAAYNRRRH